MVDIIFYVIALLLGTFLYTAKLKNNSDELAKFLVKLVAVCIGFFMQFVSVYKLLIIFGII